jgi:hypothetical protein
MYASATNQDRPSMATYMLCGPNGDDKVSTTYPTDMQDWDSSCQQPRPAAEVVGGGEKQMLFR